MLERRGTCRGYPGEAVEWKQRGSSRLSSSWYMCRRRCPADRASRTLRVEGWLRLSRIGVLMTKQAAVSLSQPGEYDVVLKEVHVERYSPQRGKTTQRLCWTLAGDGGDHH